MTNISRRGFLGGVAAATAVAALPAPAPLGTMPRIFEGSIGVYNGVLIRRVIDADLRRSMRNAVREWVALRYVPPMDYLDVVNGR